MTSDRRSKRYDAQDVPWDAGITPPEIVRVVEELAAGSALDLGCGTGTTGAWLAGEWHRFCATGGRAGSSETDRLFS